MDSRCTKQIKSEVKTSVPRTVKSDIHFNKLASYSGVKCFQTKMCTPCHRLGTSSVCSVNRIQLREQIIILGGTTIVIHYNMSQRNYMPIPHHVCGHMQVCCCNTGCSTRLSIPSLHKLASMRVADVIIFDRLVHQIFISWFLVASSLQRFLST